MKDKVNKSNEDLMNFIVKLLDLFLMIKTNFKHHEKIKQNIFSSSNR